MATFFAASGGTVEALSAAAVDLFRSGAADDALQLSAECQAERSGDLLVRQPADDTTNPFRIGTTAGLGHRELAYVLHALHIVSGLPMADRAAISSHHPTRYVS